VTDVELCPSCGESAWRGRRVICRQCSARAHRKCLTGGWCTPCLTHEPDRQKVDAFAMDILESCECDGPDDDAYVRPALLLAASLLFSPEQAVDVVCDEASPWGMRNAEIAQVVSNFEASGIWRDNHVCLDDDEGDDTNMVAIYLLVLMCGAGLVHRVETPAVPTLLA